MKKIELIATTAFGIEAIAKRELEDLGFNIIKTEDGKITFESDYSGIPIANINLRTADRVLLKMGEFKALSFEELFENVKSLDWDEWIPEDGNFIVDGKSVKSKLFSISDCQSITEKAIVEKLKKKYNVEWFQKTGADYRIQVSLLKDLATITMDTSGNGLHKRGYREQASNAPIKETLAASLVLLSFWNKDRLLLDPFCGSGTIAIEAALIGKNIAPGLNRKFASEYWKNIDSLYWKNARVNALKKIDQDSELRILAFDNDPKMIEIAKENAFEAGVDDCINFKVKNFYNLRIDPDDYGIMITNPPYGERLGSVGEAKRLYGHLGALMKNINTWSKYIITSFENFESVYGKKADRRRKLYNGKIKVDYYQYYGDRPEYK
ncbi:MAG: class I SAM-dependent RNA methyltransferase [Andreesenia angusta]|nr:class I SAM-dependent RNA methyltransferase [Andreesenia angusta]